MFCPKCGGENPAEGRFCRKCGTDLTPVSEVLTGNLRHPVVAEPLLDRKGRRINWEGAIGKLFSGLAFLIVACILGYTGMAGGKAWWFWLLIPAFSMIGAGIAQIVRLKHENQQNMTISPATNINVISGATQSNQVLPPSHEDYIPASGSIYETGELMERPPSVTEGTTRHLEINTEGETMTLPKK